MPWVCFCVRKWEQYLEDGKATRKKTISQLMEEQLVSFFFSGYSQLPLLSGGSKNSSLNFLQDQDSTVPTNFCRKPDSHSKSAWVVIVWDLEKSNWGFAKSIKYIIL